MKIKIQRSKKKHGKKWPIEQLIEAVTIAKEIGYHRASKQSGIPYSTLRNHAKRHNLIKSIKDSPEIIKFKEEVRKEALKKASNYFYEHTVSLAADLYEAAEEAVAKTRNYLRSIKRPSKEDALWIKSLVTVWLNAVQSGQLLTNKPTSREEQVNKNEYSFIEKITSDPDLTKELQKILSKRIDDTDKNITA